MKTTINDYIKFIEECIEKYQSVLKITHFTFTIQETKTDEYLACRHRYPYNDGMIIYSQESFGDWQKEPLKYHERKILHEMCHLITDPLYTKATTQFTSRSEIEDERERLTDHIAVVVHKFINGDDVLL